MPSFHPIVESWFAEALGAPSEPQRLGWPAIASGAHTLILAPTGTGKTLAAFLWELNQLIERGADEPLPNAVQILYVSPLKALSNDIHRNLEHPLAELRARFERARTPFPEIRVAVRTGDTPASARARMARKAPHILITTPESLAIMLTAPKGRGMFSMVRAVIVDEIHAVAGTKRGAHLALSLERLEALCEAPPQRIGLSATQRPLDEIARFLGGCAAAAEDTPPAFRPVTIVDCGLVKRMELAVVSPVPDLGDVSGSVWPAVAELALSYIRRSRTTLVFVNNRAQAERMAARVNALAGEELARPYHGSLARERRLALERALKAGELPALVSTSSLELGIDIGSVDLVLQLQSPKRVSAALQRVGRAGHSLGEASRGVFIPTHRDDLVESAAIVGAMREGDVEPTRVPQNALDVLAQVLVAMAAVDDWTSAGMLRLVRGAYPYHRLPRAAFDEVLGMLSGKYATELAAELEPRVTWDRVTDRVSGSRGSRLMATISGGTIPDRGLYTVHLPDRTRLGELDEEFVHESRVGDVFQLGSATWRIGAIEHDRVIVTPAPGAPARMPFWHGEFATRSPELSRRVGALRRALAARPADEDATDAELEAHYGCDPAAARSLRGYVAEQRAATGVVPDDETILIEQFRDEMGAVRLVVHSVFGGRVNAPWGMALAQRVREALGRGDAGRGVDVQVQTTDDGIMLRLPDLGGEPPVHALLGLSADEAERRVMEEVGTTSLFGARFRMCAARALLLPRGTPRRRMPLWLQRLKSLDLLEVVRQHATFPILVETYREVLQDAFDLASLREVLDTIASGRIVVRTVETPRPSPFAASLQFGFVMDWMYADDTPRAERRAALLAVDRTLLGEVMGEGESDDDTAQAMAELLAERRGTAPGRRARSADELAHLLDRAGDLTLDELRERVAGPEERGAAAAPDPLEALLATRRAVAIPFAAGEGVRWRVVLAESYPRYAAALGADRVATVRAGIALEELPAGEALPAALLAPVMEPRAARREILARFVALSGPVTVAEARARYGWSARWVEQRLDEWTRLGRLVHGRFRRDAGAPEWCSRRLAERARRRALAALRKQIRAVELPAFAAFLQRWQHVDPRDRLSGAGGLEAIVHQLAGLPRPPDGWERDYFPARLDRYDPAWLSQLGASGQVVWAGGAGEDAAGAITLRRVRFFPRGERALWLPDEPPPAPSERARLVWEALQRMGASFLPDLQAATGLGVAALRDALRELVAAGIATNDTMEALREVMRMRALPPQPRQGEPDPTRWLPADFTPSPGRPVIQRRSSARRLPKWRRPDLPGPTAAWVGRWSLLRPGGAVPPPVPDEEGRAEAIARRWLDRYGVVTRDWWRRERPALSWRAVYRELRRLELRGEVRRGYFVEGLSGAQFALPDAVERLRASRDEPPGEAPVVVVAAGDPANPYSLALESIPRTPLLRPRGAGALLVMRGGRVLMAVEGGGARVTVAPELSDAEVVIAARAIGERLARGAGVVPRRRDPKVVSIDGVPAGQSRHLGAFRGAGWRLEPDGVRFVPG